MGELVGSDGSVYGGLRGVGSLFGSVECWRDCAWG